jgi:hypothetical protein
MKRKEAVYKGLQFTPVYFEDTSLTSPDYFQISEFPIRLTAGKNLFKLRGNPQNLKVGGVLGIEILDYNGDPIYHEVVDYIDEDKSRVIAIYIYEDTSPGDCTITLLSEAVTINNTIVPAEWQNKPNIRWTRSVSVNPNVSNVSEIIFETEPELVVEEIIGVQLDRTYTNGQFPNYTTGQVRYYLYNNQPAIEISGGTFTSDMSTGTITVATPTNPTPTPNYVVVTTPYVSTIKKILSPTTALLDTEYTVYSSQSISSHTYNAFGYSAFSLSYEATPTYTPTENSQSFAYIQVKGLDPATGDVSRIKVFTNNNGTIGSWDLVNDVELEETEIFVTNTASLYPDQAVGTFVTQSTINTYWTASAYNGFVSATAPTLTWTTASLNNAMKISSSLNLDAENSVLLVKTTSSGYFIENSSYKITIDALATRNGSVDPVLSVYLSGSAFYANPTDYFNQEFPVKFGKRIGELRAVGDNQRFDDIILNFESEYTGNGTLLLIVESGEWQVADIRVTTDNDAGYSPNYTRIKTPITTTHKIDNQISFKAEYYNVAGERSKQISYVYNKDWEGGNRYIDGNFSMLTGSLYVADSLNSGVAISGYPNSGFVRSLGYEGFAAGFPGFLLWSGSALPGSAGTKGGAAYSGVGLELYANTSSYFRYATANSEIDVRTNKFFFGNPATTFISGANGNIEISASGFHLTAQGNVTASSFIAQQGGVVLFDSNNEFVDGLNVGRVVYFERAEYTYTGDLTTSPQTASIFETFILPGETRMQVSYMYEFTPAASALGTLQAEWYIQSASYTGSVGTTTGYNSWSTPQSISSTMQITPINSVATEGGARNAIITNGVGGLASFANHQGFYVRVYMIVNRTTNGNASDALKLRSFVYRTSRVTGGSTDPLPGGKIIS